MMSEANQVEAKVDEQKMPVTIRGSLDGIVLRPGDRVLIALNQPSTAEHASRMAGVLSSRFPGVEFTFVDGVNNLAVMPAVEIRKED